MSQHEQYRCGSQLIHDKASEDKCATRSALTILDEWVPTRVHFHGTFIYSQSSISKLSKDCKENTYGRLMIALRARTWWDTIHQK